jgi:hypothetical protein
MYIKDGIAYAGEIEPLLKVVGIKSLNEYTLWLRFSNHEERLYDVRPLLEYPVFAPLKDLETFKEVYLDYGAPTWLNGTIDIAPESLYEHSVPVGAAKSF